MREKSAPELRGPQRRKLLRLPLFPLEAAGLLRAFREVTADVADHPPVIVVPGLWAGDGTMRVLRRYLIKAGYDAQGWEMGRNLAGRGLDGRIADLPDGWIADADLREDRGEGKVPALCALFGGNVRRRSEALGKPIALVGWSLGGFLAREAARDHPDHVSAVVTLGSPIIGGPKYTFVNRRYRRSGLDVEWIEAQTIARHARPIRCPVTSIYSKQDAIVHWSASIDRWTPGAHHVEVGCTHTGLPFHAPTLREIHHALDRVYAKSIAEL